MAMNLGLNDASFIVEMLAELTGVRMELEMKIDNKNAYASVTSNTAPTDKKVRCGAAGIREAIISKELNKLILVKGNELLADALTKKRADSNLLLHLVQNGEEL